LTRRAPATLVKVSTEHERVARIRQIFTRPSDAVVLGIGDDCAVLAASPLPQLWTVDAAVEGVHFSRTFMREDEIAYRALMAAASDIAAMGGTARAALCALALPAGFDEHAFDALLGGFAAAADELGFPIVGGNLARARELSLTSTVLGECRGKLLTRSMARPGDGVFVTGPVGGAALGLAALRQARAGHPRRQRLEPAVTRFLRPRARLDLAPALAAIASAAIDISDGLFQDLTHICQASQVSAVVELSRLPRLCDFEQLARALGQDPTQLLLGGGEDYELLFTALPADVPPALANQIGRIEAGAACVRVLSEAGSELSPVQGFDHFR
jgi:thiamine-monophosphate kinase